MINILVDSNILRQYPDFNNASLKTLHRLGNQGILKLHIPYIVKQEFLTKRKLEITFPFLETNKNLQTILRRDLTEEDKIIITKFSERLIEMKSKLEKELEIKFDRWVSAQKGEIQSIKTNHGQEVMDAYFKGEVPFKKIKNRNDIPDAFIWQNILDLSKDHSTLCIISNDTKIYDECIKKNLIPFKTLEEFIESALLAKEITPDILFEHFFEDIKQKLPENKDYLVDQLNRDLVSKLAWKEAKSSKIPDDNNEALISLVGEARDVFFKFEIAKYYGDGLILIPFYLDVDCLLSYHIFKVDYYTMDEKRALQISVSEYDNKHYFSAEEEYELTVYGFLSIDLSSETIEKVEEKMKNFKELLTNSSITIDSIEKIIIEDNDYFDEDENYFSF
jgi:hypothetical protein